jgi:putative transposase
MSRKYKIRDQRKAYFVSFATVNWIDVFTRRIYKDIIVDSFKYCIENKGLELYAYCIMTNHVHLIMGSTGEKIEDILRDLKKHTSKELIKAIESNNQESRREWMLWMFKRAGEHNNNNKNYQFWQQNNHPIELSSNEMIDQKLEYIHYNPIEAGYVDEAENYLYSSARDYSGRKGMLELYFVG